MYCFHWCFSSVRGALVFAAFLTCVLGGHAQSLGQDPEPTSEDLDALTEDFMRTARGDRVEAPVWVEHTASFRIRPELILGGDLGNGMSPIPVPLSRLAVNDAIDPSSVLAWASMRLHYGATIHIGKPWSIHVGLDALDNLVLGSTHVNAGGDFAEGLWREAQAPLKRGVNSFQDALAVRFAFAQWRILEIVTLRAGRMPDPVGMGIWRQDGRCPDCDFGTYSDGLRLSGSFAGFRLHVGWEATASGATSELPGVPGHALNLDLSDDVTTWHLAFGRTDALTEDGPEISEPEVLPEIGQWKVDWRLHAAISEQRNSTSVQSDTGMPADCSPIYEGPNGFKALTNDCWRLFPRGIKSYRPGFWLRAQWRPERSSMLRIELEISSLIAEIGNSQQDPKFVALQDGAKNVHSAGAALEIDYRHERLSVGLDSGFAMGDDARYLGVYDGQNLVAVGDGNVNDARVLADRTLTSFWFHRDYHVDLILFRQIIGTVTNAIYVKPWISYRLLDTDSLRVGARLDVMYARAFEPKGTPGGGEHWGVESDLKVFMELPHKIGLSVDAGVFVPLDALNNPDTGARPDPTFALRGLATWRFSRGCTLGRGFGRRRCPISATPQGSCRECRESYVHSWLR